MPEPLLEIADLNAGYGEFRVLFGVSLSISAGTTLALIGANGAGKSTLLRSIVGLVRPTAGRILLDGDDLVGVRAERIARRGIALVPEGRRLFTSLSVEENLRIGASGGANAKWTLSRIYQLFPVLREKAGVSPANLSGGQQQMVAIGRALMANPRLILFDEISLGLSPAVVGEVYACLPEILGSGVSAVLVEQDIMRALDVADQVVCLQHGRVALAGAPSDYGREQIVRAYFGS